MYPRPAREKPVQINYAARNKFVGFTLAGFCAVGAGFVYAFDLHKKAPDDRSPEYILERTRRDDAHAWNAIRRNVSHTTNMIKERQRLFDEKFMPQSMKNVAKHMDESFHNLKSGQYGDDFVITKSPKITKLEQESQSVTDTDKK